MQIRKIQIPYEGRDRYKGTNGKSIKNMVTTYMGSAGVSGGPSVGTNSQGFFAFLSKASGVYSAIDLAQAPITDLIAISGYRDQEIAQTLVGDITESAATATYNILGIPDSGLTVSVYNNGTSAATLSLRFDSTISEDSGTLVIPVAINISDSPLDPYHEVWYQNQNKCVQISLRFNWTINRSGSANYILDLSNQMAGVNCDSAGTLYPNSIATLQCTATAYYNGTPVPGVTYSYTCDAIYNLTGFSIDPDSGICTFNSAGTLFNWNVAYPAVPINIIATKEGSPVGTKTMTITRNYPGSDGTPAHTRYILTDADYIIFDPETSGFTPNSVVGQVWLQVGDELPVQDTATTIYQWYDGLETGKTSATGSITATTYLGLESITFGLQNTGGSYYEKEDVPVIPKGVQGPAGPSGATGPSGESAWYLTLTNDNATINCDSAGTILAGAVRPQTCICKLYHGSHKEDTVSYSYSANTGYTGVTFSESNGNLSIAFTTAFTFNDDVLSITVSASTDSTLRDVKTMNIVKAYPGANGEAGTTYWLVPNFTEVIWNPNSNTCSPTKIMCSAYTQEGQGAVHSATTCTIKYAWQSRSSESFTGENNLPSTGLSMTTSLCESYKRLRLILYLGAAQVDMEDIDILKDGLDGASGQGRTGAAIRGPYDYATHSGSSRWWCAGDSACTEWIDVIIKNGTYYYCNQTYYGTIDYGMANTRRYWTSGDSFDFVATNLLLAENAKINFLTGNEIYLMCGTTITAGAAGGNGINFWAGDTTPSTAPFRVNYDGTMVATKGTFGPFTIGSDPAYSSEAALKGSKSRPQYDSQDHLLRYDYNDASLSPNIFQMEGGSSGGSGKEYDRVVIAPSSNSDYYDFNGVMQIDCKRSEQGQCAVPSVSNENAVWTNGNLVGNKVYGTGNTYRNHAGPNTEARGIMSPLGMEITYMTSSMTQWAAAGNWYINNQDTGISALEDKDNFYYTINSKWCINGKSLQSYYGRCCNANNVSDTIASAGTRYWHFNGNRLDDLSNSCDATQYPYVGYVYKTGTSITLVCRGTGSTSTTGVTLSGEEYEQYVGYWVLSKRNNYSKPDLLCTGIAHPSYIKKRNNVLYLLV